MERHVFKVLGRLIVIDEVGPSVWRAVYSQHRSIMRCLNWLSIYEFKLIKAYNHLC